MKIENHENLANEISKFRSALIEFQTMGSYPVSSTPMKLVGKLLANISNLRCELDRLIVAENKHLDRETRQTLTKVYFQPPTCKED